MPATTSATVTISATTVTETSRTSTTSTFALLLRIVGELDLLMSQPDSVNASAVPEGLAKGLAEMLGLDSVEVYRNTTLEENATEEGLVRMVFVADAEFYISEEAENFLLQMRGLSDMTGLQVKDLLNAHLELANATVRVDDVRRMSLRASAVQGSNLDFNVIVVGTEDNQGSVPPPSASSVGLVWLIVAAAVAIIVLSAILFFYFYKTAARSQGKGGAAQEERTGTQPKHLDFTKPGGLILPAEPGNDAHEEDDERETLAIIIDACKESESELTQAVTLALDSLGIGFVEDEDMSSLAMAEAFADAGIELFEDDPRESALAMAGIEWYEDNGRVSVVSNEREPVWTDQRLVTAAEEAGISFKADDPEEPAMDDVLEL
ncbi:SELP [Symbiodinium pilosum]|uniref:SELP protein n=1 Tax=Symbiodinium pilosum TaxID=2952 RepID=A0A812PR45_SYMPI|nr:SELP [Symbiodinium pilosum]